VKRAVLLLMLAAIPSGAGLASAQDGRGGGRRSPMPFASPGKVVAAEIALSQLARRKGQWKAFRETAADDAVMFVPQPVEARQWLKSQPEPAAPMAWQPHEVFVSCDGSLAVATGPWQASAGSAYGAQGTFITVWRRHKKGEYQWVMTHADDRSAAPGASDMIRSSVATCERGARPPAATTPTIFPAGTRGGWSADRTLGWTVTVAADCSRTLNVSLSRGAGKPLEAVLERTVPASTTTGCAAS
jgi:ketosteroid isomerase-like protein